MFHRFPGTYKYNTDSSTIRLLIPLSPAVICTYLFYVLIYVLNRFHSLDYLSESFDYLVISIRDMRFDAVRAVFHTIEHLIVAPALFTESIKRTVAEETVEILFVQSLMAWKVFAFFVAEESFGFVFHSHLFISGFIRWQNYTIIIIYSS